MVVRSMVDSHGTGHQALDMTHSDRDAIRASLLDRRHRLESLPPAAAKLRVAGLLAEVDAALDRLEGGRFGTCVRCDEPIEADRIAADPLATVCLDCLTDGERDALQRDLELASQVQATLLPPRRLQAGRWQGHYLYRPHGTVSGDYVDVVAPGGPSGDLLVLLGDVSGKGVAAALLMSHLHAVFRATAAVGTDLVDMVARANRLLSAVTSVNAYATLVAARLQPDGLVELCTAGHTPPLLMSPSGVTEMGTDGMPLGLFVDAAFGRRTVALEPGDGLLFYTDGLTESAGPDDVEFGVDGVRAVLVGESGAPPETLVRRVADAAERHRAGAPAHDDLTVMAIQRA